MAKQDCGAQHGVAANPSSTEASSTKWLFQLPNQHSSFCFQMEEEQCLQAHPASALPMGDNYLWSMVEWNMYMYYFASPCKSSRSLIVSWLISIFSLSPPRELKSGHFLSLLTSSFLGVAAGNSCLVSCCWRSFCFNSFGCINLL